MMNIPDELDMGKMGMDRTGLKNGITREFHNEVILDAYRSVLGIVTKCERESFPKEFPNGGTNNGTYNAVILERGERSQVVRSYADVTREYGKTPLGQNRLIIS